MYTIGIDDAGRGPIIGPMILSGVLLTKDQEEKIKQAGATDSKLLSQSQRIKISKLIKSNSVSYKILKSSPEEIDDAILNNSKMNLNTLEAKKAAEIINFLNKKDKITVIIDCPSVNTEAWKKTLLSFIKNKSNLKIKCEHKADLNHTSVSAASILAKVAREEEVARIRKQYGDLGSGYPSDPKTKQFLKDNGKRLENSGIFRKSWATWKRLFLSDNFKNNSQKSLSEFR
jgi:ribonuclease HII